MDMNNKISNTNFENEKRLNNFIEAYKQTKEQEFIVESINKDFFFEFVDCLLTELEQKDKRIQELEKELEKANRQLDLDYVDDNYISKQKVKDKIELHKNYLLNQAITSNPTLDSHFRDRENYLMQTLQELL